MTHTRPLRTRPARLRAYLAIITFAAGMIYSTGVTHMIPPRTVDAQTLPIISPLSPVFPTPKFSTVPLHPSDSSWETFKQTVKTIAPLYDFPVNVALAQAALESDRGHSEYAVDRNNFFGIAAYDYDPDMAWGFDNPAHCIIEYMHIVKKNFPTAYADRHNPDQMLRDMEDSADGVVYATDPDYVTKVESLPEWSEQ